MDGGGAGNCTRVQNVYSISINIYKYKLIKDLDYGPEYLGVKAQEVEQIYPDGVSKSTDILNKTNFKTKDTDLIKELDRYLGIKHNKCFILFYLYLNVILPFVKSYGDISNLTLSPGNNLM